MTNPSGAIKAVIIIFIVGVTGFFLFPSINAEITAVDTTGWNDLAAGVKALLPYAFIGAIFMSFFFIWYFKGRE